jgi:hypothetical protein
MTSLKVEGKSVQFQMKLHLAPYSTELLLPPQLAPSTLSGNFLIIHSIESLTLVH